MPQGQQASMLQPLYDNRVLSGDRAGTVNLQTAMNYERENAYRSSRYSPWPSDLKGNSGIQVIQRAARQFTLNQGKVFYKPPINRPGLVVFYYSQCHHCHKLADVALWQRTGIQKGVLFDVDAFNYGQVPIILVDSQEKWRDPATGQIESNDALLKYLGVNSYPTIFILNSDGSLGSTYEGRRTPQDFIDLIGTL